MASLCAWCLNIADPDGHEGSHGICDGCIGEILPPSEFERFTILADGYGVTVIARPKPRPILEFWRCVVSLFLAGRRPVEL